MLKIFSKEILKKSIEVCNSTLIEFGERLKDQYIYEDGIYEYILISPITMLEDIKIETVSFGVADNIDQIKKWYREEIDDENEYIISIRKVVKSEQPEEGGWRWRKWGIYIGDKLPKYEYLVSEGPEFEEVYCFELYLVIEMAK